MALYKISTLKHLRLFRTQTNLLFDGFCKEKDEVNGRISWVDDVCLNAKTLFLSDCGPKFMEYFLCKHPLFPKVESVYFDTDPSHIPDKVLAQAIVNFDKVFVTMKSPYDRYTYGKFFDMITEDLRSPSSKFSIINEATYRSRLMECGDLVTSNPMKK